MPSRAVRASRPAEPLPRRRTLRACRTLTRSKSTASPAPRRSRYSPGSAGQVCSRSPGALRLTFVLGPPTWRRYPPGTAGAGDRSAAPTSAAPAGRRLARRGEPSLYSRRDREPAAPRRPAAPAPRLSALITRTPPGPTWPALHQPPLAVHSATPRHRETARPPGPAAQPAERRRMPAARPATNERNGKPLLNSQSNQWRRSGIGLAHPPGVSAATPSGQCPDQRLHRQPGEHARQQVVQAPRDAARARGGRSSGSARALAMSIRRNIKF